MDIIMVPVVRKFGVAAKYIDCKQICHFAGCACLEKLK